jgi:hypothetical protein
MVLKYPLWEEPPDGETLISECGQPKSTGVPPPKEVQHPSRDPPAQLHWRRCIGGGPALAGWACASTPGPSSASKVCLCRIRFPPEVITIAVRWYLRYVLSYRDVEELLAERGAQIDHITVYRWVQRFTPLLIDAARLCRHVPVVAGLWTRRM